MSTRETFCGQIASRGYQRIERGKRREKIGVSENSQDGEPISIFTNAVA